MGLQLLKLEEVAYFTFIYTTHTEILDIILKMGLISASKFIIIFIISTVNISLSDSNATYIEIDHGLVPREIKNINDMSPLPVPPGRDSVMKKYTVSKRPIQEIILDIDENKQSNNINI